MDGGKVLRCGSGLKDTEGPKFGARFCVLAQYTVECSVVEFETQALYWLSQSLVSIHHCPSCMKEGCVSQDSGISVLTDRM